MGVHIPSRPVLTPSNPDRGERTERTPELPPHHRLTLPNPFNRLRRLRTPIGLPFMVGSIDVRLPDGSVKEVPKGTTARDGVEPVSSLRSE